MKIDGRQLRKDINEVAKTRGWDVEFRVSTLWNQYDEPELEVYFTKVTSDQIKVIGEFVDWWFNFYRRNLKASRKCDRTTMTSPYAGYYVIQGAFTL